ENRELDRATINAKTRLIGSEAAGHLDLIALAGFANFGLPGALRNDDVSAGRMGFYDSYDPLGEGTSIRGLMALSYARTQQDSDLAVTAYGGYRKLDLL